METDRDRTDQALMLFKLLTDGLAVCDRLTYLLCGLGISALAYGLWHVAWVLYRKCFWNLPPSYGVCLPFLGHLLYFRGVKDLPKAFGDKCKTLKSRLVYVRLAGFDAIVICDYKLALEAFVNRDLDFSDRPHFPVFESVFMDILLTRDATPVWKVERKLFHESVRLYASGRLLEEHSYEAVRKMLAVLRSEKGPFDPLLHLYLSVYHMITMICLDKSYSLDDGEFLHLVDVAKKAISFINGGVLADFMPILQYFPLNLVDVNQRKLRKVGADYYNYVAELFKERRSQFDGNNPSCLVDHLLNYYEKLKWASADEEERAALDRLKLTNLMGLCFITYAAGVDSSTCLINWFIYLMALHPDVQTKLRAHLADVLGSRRPKLSDKSHLSYFRAVLLEVMRVAPVAPLGIPHRNSSDTSLAGYDVPANTMIICNQLAFNHDPVYWGQDVDSFRPERFLNEDGTLAPTPDGFMAFGCGRRACPGQSLALNEFLLLLPPLFQHLEFRFPDGFVPLKIEETGGDIFIFDAPSYQIEVHEV